MSRDAELEVLRAGVSCAVLLERHPPTWQLDKRESTRNCLKYRRGVGEIILVTHQGRGWWDPGSTAKGDIFSLVQHLEPGLNLGQVRRVLRPLAGLQATYPEHLRQRSGNEPSSPRPFGERWEKRRRPTRGSPSWQYLVQERGLPVGVVQAAIVSDVLREGPHDSVWFAHQAEQGRLTGFEMRGSQFRSFSPGGEKTLFRLHGGLDDEEVSLNRLAVTEAPIDALSLAALEGMRQGTLYVATGGGMGPGTRKEIDRVLRSMLTRVPDPILVGATDNDRAGERYAEQLAEMAAAVRFERLRPTRKDWNDMLKGREA